MSKTDYDKAMLLSWHSFEEYNLCHLSLHTGTQNPHPNKHTKKHALQTRTVESITSFYLTADSLRERTGHNGGYK